MSKTLFQRCKKAVSLFVFLAWLPAGLLAQDAPTVETPAAIEPPAAVEPEPDAAVHQALRAYLQLQEQLHATKLALAESRQAMELAAAQNAIALSNRLQNIEASLATRQAAELDAMQSANRLMLLAVGLFAALGFMAILLTAYFQWRAIHRLGEITANLPARALAALPEVSALGLNDRQLTNGAVEQSNTRLLGVIERLEQRIAELEHTGKPALPAPEGSVTDGVSAVPDARSGASNGDRATQITMLLGKGQSLLYLDQAEEAVACFNEVLALEPGHTEALIKKGTALEKLRKPQEAIECYDQVIAADSGMTIAYLYKGGLCNRLERFTEAMECYEQALRTQEKKRAA